MRVRLAIAILAMPLLSFADTAHGTAAGGPIPAGAFATSGVVTSAILLSNSGVVATGNAVTVNILGLQHDFAGDLQITLSYINSSGVTVQSVDIANRIGVTSSNPYGTAADFGNDQANGDNYQFNSDDPGNIWAVAACSDPPACTTPYGDADSIPGVSTDTVNNGQYFTSTTGGTKTNLSYAFAGLSVSCGTWRLTITDAAQPNVGSYIGWEIYVTTGSATGMPATISAVSGTPQSTTVGTSFGKPLQALVADSSGNPVTGVTVTFSAPSSGASATFSGAASVTEVTNASGIATSPLPTANNAAGAYTIAASVSGLTSASFSLLNTAATTGGASAVFQPTDSATQGTWTGAYGVDAQLIPGDLDAQPPYGSVAQLSGYTAVWDPSTSDVRALQTASGSATRIASTYYDGSFNVAGSHFSVDSNLTDGNAHRLALYICDWDNHGRNETISLLDASSQTVLSSQAFANFQNGVYGVWNVKGHVVILITNSSGNFNSLLNGIFLDPVISTPGPAAAISPTSLTFGTQTVGLPSGSQAVTVSNSGNSGLTISAVSVAGTNASDFSQTNTCNGASLATGAKYTVNVVFTPSAAGSRTANLTIADNAPGSPQSVALNGTGAAASSGASAVYTRTDTTTQGTWTGAYGATAQIIPGDLNNQPAYDSVTQLSGYTAVWDASTSDIRALQTASGASSRIASTYYDGSFYVAGSHFSIDVNLTDGNTHQLALYLCDWDDQGRNETISILDASDQAALSSQSFSNFQNGIYGVWSVKGHVIILVTNNGSASFNSLLNGIFLK